MEQIPLREAKVIVRLHADRSKNSKQINDFNAYLGRLIAQEIPHSVQFIIEHVDSRESKGIQAVDLFAYGINRKYEYGDHEWYGEFRRKIEFETVYLP